MKFIENCRKWWKMWSVQAAVVFATVSAAVVANPSLLLGLIDRLPEPWRTVAVPVAWIVCFAVPVALRLLEQPKLKEGEDDKA